MSDYHFTEIEIVQAAPYTSSLSPVVGVVNMMCSTAEGLLFRRIFPNPVYFTNYMYCIAGQMSSGLKETVGSAVENLDSMACSGLDQLTERSS